MHSFLIDRMRAAREALEPDDELAIACFDGVLEQCHDPFASDFAVRMRIDAKNAENSELLRATTDPWQIGDLHEKAIIYYRMLNLT